MKKEYIIGGLALLGVIGLVSYLRKPKRNSEGFFGATGKGGSIRRVSRPVCVRRNADGSSTTYSQQGGSRPCPYGGTLTS
jgi:hypothetical protein